MPIDNVPRTGASASLTPFLDSYDAAALLPPPPRMRTSAAGDRLHDSYAGEPDAAPVAPSSLRESPFLSEYAESEEEAGDPMGELVDELLDGLHDEELDEAIGALADELRGLVAREPALEAENDGVREAMLRETVAPLVRAAQADIGRAAQAIGALDLGTAGEEEIDAAVDAAPLPEVTSPAFEFFLKGLRNKIKKVARSAARLARRGLTPALGLLLKPLLAKLQVLAKPMIDKVVAFALDKVPEPYKPLVATLAARLRGQVQGAATAVQGGSEPAPNAEPAEPTATTAPVPQEPATPDTAQAQQELDMALADVALAGDRVDREVIESGQVQPVVARDPYADLTRARERFVREITQAGGAEEAEVAVERFLPAVMVALRQGIRFFGRERVVGLLGKPIATLVAPLIGKKNAPALGKILADIGLRTFLHAEVDPATELEVAGQAIAATVEETVRRLAQLPDELVEEPETLAALAHEAFEASVGANFPATLVRSELRETERPGAWVLLPARGRKRVKKFSHVFDVTISPAVARSVRGYGSSTLAGLFRDRLRLPADATVAARVHLYEAVPGTSLAAIAQTEEARGLGSSDAAVWSQIQPLTPEAGLLLLGSPGLGRELPDGAEPSVPLVGQRFYYLEIAEAPPRPLGRESHVRVAVDPRQGQIRLGLYLSEVVAQKVATALRAKKPAVTVVADLRALLAPATGALGHANAHGLVRIHGLRRLGATPARAGAAGRGARQALRRQLGSLALNWAWKHLAANLDAVAPELIAKTDGPEDGVRLVFSFHVPGGLAGVGRLFRGHSHHVSDWPPRAPSRTTLTIQAGPRHA